MLASKDAMATIAVRTIDVARKFYEQKLGFKPLESSEDSVLNYQSGKTTLLVYVSPFAGSNQATSATWAVGDDFDGILQSLQARGVTFEHYDLPGLLREGDVHVAGAYRGAWFKDPDGNILHILNQ
ncbi:VOC family protein [Polaromonas sp.]|uniref:VOC family protein n=1 Tax=Polaromonas sp. TaxID=1869339 RepID=UPI00286BDD85|nr:VOC family protein [Polaromonas sp.]